MIARSLRLVAMLAAVVWMAPALAMSAQPVAPKSTPKKAPPQKAAPAAKPRPTPTPTPKTTRATGKSSARAAKPAATPPPAKPDRSLYQAAERAEKTLRASPRLKAKKVEWEKVASAYRVVVSRYPRSPYCDDALLSAGDLQREMADLFNNRRYSDQALESYALIVDEYPGSSLGEDALFGTYQIQKERSQTSAARETAEKYIAAYPQGKRAKALGQVVAESRPGKAAKAGAPSGTAGAPPTGGSQFERTSTSTGHAQIYGVRFWSGDASTRVVIDLDRKVEITQSRLQDPPRLFVDLKGTRLHPNLVGKTFPVGNAFLKQIRIGVNRENVVRVVVDFGEASSHNVFFLADPERLVIDVRGEGGLRTATLEPRPGPSPSPLPANAPQEVAMENVQVTQAAPILPEVREEGEEEPEAAPLAAPAVAPTVRPAPTALPTPEATPPPRPAATPLPPSMPVNGTPVKNRDGSYSLARQLGLGARRIALDAGHGGHDPGAIGKRGTQEKDLTLAIVLKLEKLLRTELGADVVLTRDKDVFIPLEERTAIANASGADLFLSVHINSARNSAGRGLETYYLSFAKNAAAEELAARENAISQATMKDLNNLVKAITTNSKIDESREFAGLIQRSNVEGLSPSFQGVLDRGVHTAPFYVLIGANMPSILTEVGFISNPEEERWLRSDEYQQKLAESLLEGVRSYLGQLNRTQASKLGARPGVRVSSKSKR